MTKEKLREKANSIVQSLTDQQLLDAFVDIITREKTPDHNSVRIWLIDEIESRYPEIEDAMLEDYLVGNDTSSYDERLIGHFKEFANV
jgi:hypothetical protein